MKIAAISGIKNEADIIESFVRHNSRYIDDFYFVNDSVDNTTEILRNLGAEGFSISIINLDTRDYQHSQVMTMATRLVGSSKQYDWIFYLDGDEILASASKESFYGALARPASEKVGNLLMVDYGYNGRNYFESSNPLKECFNKNTNNVKRQKIFIRGEISAQVVIGTGQHNAFSLKGEPLAYFESRIELAHFPARSPEQWVTRNILRYSGLIAKQNRFQGEGSHVIEIFDSMKNVKFETVDTQFIDRDNLTEETPDFLEDITCRYQNLAKINERLVLAMEIERQAILLSEFRHKIAQAINSAKKISELQDLLSAK